MNYFVRLAQQSGLGPPETFPDADSAHAADLVEIRDEREFSPLPQTTASPMPELERAALKASAVRPAASLPSPQPFGATRADLAHRPTTHPERSLPPTGAPPGEATNTEELHLRAVREIVEWIAAAPAAALQAAARESDPNGPPQESVVEPAAPDHASPAAPAMRAGAPAQPLEQAPGHLAMPLAVTRRELMRAPRVHESGASREGRPERTAAEPAGESLSLSIGSIQITVEAPAQAAPRAAAAQPSAPAPRPPSPATAAAPSRLRRHYLRPY